MRAEKAGNGVLSKDELGTQYLLQGIAMFAGSRDQESTS
jgi:hypothetical protein